jgi:hypothetical protein
VARLSQTDWLQEWFRRHSTITRVEAMEQGGVGRLGARIQDLEAMGYVFATRLVPHRNARGQEVRIAEYAIRSTPAAGKVYPESAKTAPAVIVDKHGQTYFT